MSDSDIGLPTYLGHLLFTLYIRTYVLSFAYTILGLSSSHHQQSVCNDIHDISSYEYDYRIDHVIHTFIGKNGLSCDRYHVAYKLNHTFMSCLYSLK